MLILFSTVFYETCSTGLLHNETKGIKERNETKKNIPR
jgi:hypothetical protein